MNRPLSREQIAALANSPAANIQANVLRAVKIPGIDARNWSLYFFFRILKKSETRPVPQLLAGLGGTPADADETTVDRVIEALAAGLAGGGAPGPAEAEAGEESPQATAAGADLPDSLAAADEFYQWLARITGVELAGAQAEAAEDATLAGKLARQLGGKLDTASVRRQLKAMLAKDGVEYDRDTLGLELFGLLQKPGGALAAVARILQLVLGNLASPTDLLVIVRTIKALGEGLQGNRKVAAQFLFVLSAFFKVLVSSPDIVKTMLAKLGEPHTAGLSALHGGLPLMCIYEILRQVSRPAKAGSVVRDDLSQSADDLAGAANVAGKAADPMPVNIAFTYPGFLALHLDPQTLGSFPDVFKEGMAARAERLGDTGASAPENWDGALGLRSVHGHFDTRFIIGDGHTAPKEEPWRNLREDIFLFNNRSGPRGRLLRALIGALFRPLGMEILHIELGQDPYEVDEKTGEISHLKYRREHFGFRDGISQPFVNMGLGTPPAGGGTPRRNRTWDTVAPGEVFLGREDEDGHVQVQPANELLRTDATYQVFRKLEQDVVGFRNFLKRLRPTRQGQEKLAAQFMGRWKDGTPLVVSPDAETGLGDDPDGRTNDFLYVRDDPGGSKCPLGSHIRRSNPRDIGGNRDAKRHRILRRGIAYGGPLLPEDSPGDGEERGLLFVAVNSRIDLQFELVQSNWINNGEFLGQAGLGRCPVTGANNGGVEDRFHEAGAAAPVHNIPRFVTTRGGDYFFVPGLEALRAIARGETFPPDDGWQGDGWLDDIATPSLFQPTRIRGYMLRILSGQTRKITVKPPPAPQSEDLPFPHDVVEDPLAGAAVTFVGLNSDVKKVLRDNTGDDTLFSVAHYREACRRTTRGYDLLIGTELKTGTGDARRRLQTVLQMAWSDFVARADFYSRLAEITDDSLKDAVNRTSQRGQIDLVRDLATDTVYRIVSELFGVAGPSWLTEIAIALPFARKQVGDLERDWLSTLGTEKPENPGLITLQLWSVIFLADLVGNHMRAGELNELARKSGAEFMTHLESLVAKARTQRRRDPKTLLETFVAVEQEAIAAVRADDPSYSVDDYYIDVIVLLLELVGTPMSVIPTAWGNVMGSILNFGIDLPTLFTILGDPEPPMIIAGGKVSEGPYSWIRQLLYEVDRLNPSFKIFMRRSEQANRIDDGLTIDEGHWVAAMAIAANFDPRAHPEPKEFSLYPFLPGPCRDPANYLMFGSAGGGRDCWGRDRLALYLLDQFVRTAAKLDGLQKVAGPGGDPMKLLEVTVGLPARFARQRIRPVA